MQGFWSNLFPEFGSRTLIMGVLNVTPDSFSDGGKFFDVDAAIKRGLAMVSQGADLIDVGGESTRPGAALISIEEELKRILPVIQGLREYIPLSIDTNKSEVVDAVAAEGASIINDISGGQFDPEIRATVARHKLGFIMMHARAKPESMQKGQWVYEGGVVEAVRASLASSVEKAKAAGIPEDHLMIDPGFGFGKTLEENCLLLGNLERFHSLNLPVLVGTSKKSFLGLLTDKTVENRGFATAASIGLAAAKGVNMVRVHDVDSSRDVLRVVDACTRPFICD